MLCNVRTVPCGTLLQAVEKGVMNNERMKKNVCSARQQNQYINANHQEITPLFRLLFRLTSTDTIPTTIKFVIALSTISCASASNSVSNSETLGMRSLRTMYNGLGFEYVIIH